MKTGRIASGALLTLLLLAIPFVIRMGYGLVNEDQPDFATYYWASFLAFHDGRSPYDVPLFTALAKNGASPFLYPPPSLLFFYPLSRLAYDTARMVFLLINQLCLFVSLRLMMAGMLDWPRRKSARCFAEPFR
jgi:hypothetical protein